MADKDLKEIQPVTNEGDEETTFDWMEFWELHRVKIVLGVLAMVVVAAVAVFWKVSGDAALEGAEAAFAAVKNDDYSAVITNYPKSPTSARALLLMADEDFKKARYDQAIARYKQFQEQFPSHQFSEAAAYGIASCLEAKGQLPQAIEAYQAMVTKPNGFLTGDARMGLGRCYEAQSNWEKARENYEFVVVAFQGSPISEDAGKRWAFVKRKLKAESPPAPANGATTTPPVAPEQKP